MTEQIIIDIYIFIDQTFVFCVFFNWYSFLAAITTYSPNAKIQWYVHIYFIFWHL